MRRSRNRRERQKEAKDKDKDINGINVDNEVLKSRTLSFCNKSLFIQALFELPSLNEESTWHIHTPVSKPGLFPTSDIRARYLEVLLYQRTQAVLPHFLGSTTNRLDLEVGSC